MHDEECIAGEFNGQATGTWTSHCPGDKNADAHLLKVLQHRPPSLADRLVGWHSQPCLPPRIADDAGGRLKANQKKKQGQRKERGKEATNTGLAEIVPCSV